MQVAINKAEGPERASRGINSLFQTSQLSLALKVVIARYWRDVQTLGHSMDPFPIASPLRSLCSLAKESCRVANRANQFSSCVETPIGRRLKELADMAQIMSAVGQDLGDVVKEVDHGSTHALPDGSRGFETIDKTIEDCKAALERIDTSIAKGMDRIATDPDYLDRLINLTTREREAFGLTELDIRRAAAKIEYATTKLRLQKSKLVKALHAQGTTQSYVLLSLSRGSIPLTFPRLTAVLNTDHDIRQREREIAELSKRLVDIKKFIEDLNRGERQKNGTSTGAPAQSEHSDAADINEMLYRHRGVHKSNRMNASRQAGSESVTSQKPNAKLENLSAIRKKVSHNRGLQPYEQSRLIPLVWQALLTQSLVGKQNDD